MFLSSVLTTIKGSGLLLLLALFLCLCVVGFLLQFSLCRRRAPLPILLLPVVLCLLSLLLIYSCQMRWLVLPLRAFNTLVRGGLLRMWGVCIEGFLVGCSIGWVTRLFDRNVKKK